ncbi:IS3 family transposase [Rubinisphaera italica]|uniref:IS3 family transposase n=1 Tax=Rubinisphaera italica TaxID=2527969 RepID=UPI0036F22CF4
MMKELAHRDHYRTRGQACRSLFEYIETFYNWQCSHSRLGYILPMEFEQAIKT